MILDKFIVRRITASAIITFVSGTIPMSAFADNVTLESAGGSGNDLGSYLVTSKSSGDAFTTLLNGSVQVGMSSRRVRPSEARSLRDLGSLYHQPAT